VTAVDHKRPAGSEDSPGRRGPAGRAVRQWVMLTGGILLVLVVIPFVILRAPRVAQPVAFSHQRHTEELLLGCDFCHKYVMTGAHSGLPGAETCSLCHSVPLGSSPEAARLTELLQEGQPLEFAKLFRLPAHVFYTHRRHVAIGGIECGECHGGIAHTALPPERPLVKIDMAFCLACHREGGITTDCTACHR